jgi:muramoyltetrapeptide carboxypeptidase
MLTQLGQAGVLKGSGGRGLWPVHQLCCRNPDGSSFTLNSILRQHFEPLGIPAFEGAWFGHISDQFTIPQGVMAEIDADAGTLRLLEPAVA